MVIIMDVLVDGCIKGLLMYLNLEYLRNLNIKNINRNLDFAMMVKMLLTILYI